MLLRGMEFLIVGMSVVFLFLILLVVVLILVTHLLQKLSLYRPEEQTVQDEGLSNAEEREIAAAIAAIKNFNRNQ
jgi:sodium pump decarboxylase gamma subunit